MGNRVNCFRGLGEEGNNLEERVFDDVKLNKRQAALDENELDEENFKEIVQEIRVLYCKMVIYHLKLGSYEEILTSKTPKTNEKTETSENQKNLKSAKKNPVKNGNVDLDQVDEKIDRGMQEKKNKDKRPSKRSKKNKKKNFEPENEESAINDHGPNNEVNEKDDLEPNKTLAKLKKHKKSESATIIKNIVKPLRNSLNLSNLKYDEDSMENSEQKSDHYTDAFSPTRRSFNSRLPRCRLQTKNGKEILRDFSIHPFNGEGRYIFPDKTEYEGQWLNNRMHGLGEFKWPDGRVYKGQFANGHKEGAGVMTWKNGQVFEGNWKDGKQHGEGKLMMPGRNGMFCIEGVWEFGLRIKIKN